MYFQTLKPFSALVTIFITLFLLLLGTNKVNSSQELSFSFTNFSAAQKNVILQGNASLSPTGKLRLTKVDENGNPLIASVGRALYSTPIRVWDKSTGDEASIATFFSFVVKAANNPSDGLAFFIAPVDTQPQGQGGLLGIFKDDTYNSSNQIVAVEFDTYFNPRWDTVNPRGIHLGINVNTIRSKKDVAVRFRNGYVATVLVTYDPSNKSLVASLVYPKTKESYLVSAVVDLKKTVPEWVRVGFSATTGFGPNFVETHDILSWSFKSKLPAGDNDVLGLTTTSLHHDHMNNQLSSF